MWPSMGPWAPGPPGPVGPPPGMGPYTPDQWAAMQQQNWQQWTQWEQQYSQWQSQYGDKYPQQMMGMAPPLPVAPPVPPPPEQPPPPPPQEADSQSISQSISQPFSQPINQPISQPNYNQNAIVNTNNQSQSWSSNLRSVPINNLQGNQVTPSNEKADPADVEALKKLEEEQKLFDVKIKNWEQDIEKWRRENANHPDKETYRMYEQKFETWIKDALDRRQVMQKEWLRLSSKINNSSNSNKVSNTGNSNANNMANQNDFVNFNNITIPTNDSGRGGVRGRGRGRGAGIRSGPVSYNNDNNQHGRSNQYDNSNQYNRNRNERQTNNQYDNSGQYNNRNDNSGQYNNRNDNSGQYNKNNRNDNKGQYNNSRNDNSNYDSGSQYIEDFNSEDTNSSFLPQSGQKKGIPGLDLVADQDKMANQGSNVPKQPPQSLRQNIPPNQPNDFTAISKGINSILGDEKIMNILSMVSQQGLGNIQQQLQGSQNVPQLNRNVQNNANLNQGNAPAPQNMAQMNQSYNNWNNQQSNNQSAMPQGMRMQNSGMGPQGPRFRPQGPGMGPQGHGMRPQGPGMGPQGSGMRPQNSNLMPQGSPRGPNIIRPAPPPPQTPAPEPVISMVEPIIFDVSIIVDYDHKSLRQKARNFIEPVYTYDYDHKSKDDEYGSQSRDPFNKEDELGFTRRQIEATRDRSSWEMPTKDYQTRSGSWEDRDNRRRFDDRRRPEDNRRHDDRYDDRRREDDRRRGDERRRDDRDRHRPEPIRERYDRPRDDRNDRLRDDRNDRLRDDRNERMYDDRTRDMDRNYDRSRDRVRESSREGDTRKREFSGIDDTIPKRPKEAKPQVVMIDDVLEPPGRNLRPEKILIVLRGLPGSGKSYLAKLIRDREMEHGGSVRILSIDDYFMQEVAINEADPDTGKSKTELKFEYDASVEESYIESLKRSLKKAINDGFYNFIIYDANNENENCYNSVTSFAKLKGFQVYICTMETQDPEVCQKRNIHNRTYEDICAVKTRFEPNVKNIILDATTLLQNAAITDVDMEDVCDDMNIDDLPEAEVSSAFTSKWDQMDDVDKLARLDGTSKPLRHSVSMQDYLQLDEWTARSAAPGKKTVRWADIEERREQEKIRAIGFVVGQTDWNRMTDPTMGQSALTQTKYIERARRH